MMAFVVCLLTGCLPTDTALLLCARSGKREVYACYHVFGNQNDVLEVIANKDQI